MYWINPYLKEGQWLKGNLHTHTTVSDGRYSLVEVLKLYSEEAKNSELPELNYRFIALTDHNKGTKKENFALPQSDDLIVLEGREETYAKHILGIDCPMNFDDDKIGKPSNEYTLDDYQKVINNIIAEGGIAILPHPHWSHWDYWTAVEVVALENYTAIEILNGDIFAGPSSIALDIWDAALSAGKKVWAVGSDDFHTTRDFHNAWICLYAENASKSAIMSALRQGSFYTSSGAAFKQIYTDGKWIVAECLKHGCYHDSEKTFRFIGKGGHIVQAQTGKNNIAAYKQQGDELYIRAELSLAWGSAYTQAFFRADS